MSNFLLILFMVSFMGTKDLEDSLAQENATQELSLENKIGYKKGLLGSKLDYQLLPSDNRKFVIKITNANSSNLDVKIYDVIGNLILTDNLSDEENGQKEYDFSDRKTKIFVVKVGAGEENLTKKVTI